MPMDGIMAGFAARELDSILRDGRIDRITQPERDTVIITVRAGNANRQLLLCASPNNARLHLTESRFANPLEPPALCMLLRKQLTGGRIRCVSQVQGDRIIHVNAEAVNEMGDHVLRRLVLEIMGRHSNLILLDENGKILEAARHVNAEMSRVRQIQPGMIYAAPPEQDRTDPAHPDREALRDRLEREKEKGSGLAEALGASVTGLSRRTAKELAFRIAGHSGTDEWEPGDVSGKLADLLQRLPEMTDPRVLVNDRGEAEDVFPFLYLSEDPEKQRQRATVSKALEAFFGSRDAKDRLRQRSAAMVKTLKSQLERCGKKLALQEEALESAEKMEEYRRAGDAINGNLFRLKKGMTEVYLPDWNSEDGKEILVALDPVLTPAQNAQRYFKKYQKARSARETAAVQKEKTLQELELLEGMLLDVDKCSGESELEEIRQEMVREGYLKRSQNRRQQKQLPQSRPYRYISSDGIEILVGKNAAQNDRLTLGAKPGEMWLHAKDMPGSHVIIRAEGEIPRETMRQAAMLAAWYSKGKNSSMVPVDYTLKKYVKKPSGAAPGKVIYTHHRTAYMTAEESEIARITLAE